MSAQIISTRLGNLKHLKSITEQNAQMLYVIADIIHFLYGDASPQPFGPPPKTSDLVQQLQYESTLVSHVRKVLFNQPTVTNVNASNVEKAMLVNISTYLELSNKVKCILKKYKSLEFNDVDDRVFAFDLQYVDFRTTVEIEDFLSSPVVLSKNSASASVVYHGSWKQNGVYVKTFLSTDEGLLFEKEIYRYIKHQVNTTTYKDTYKNHFILPIFSCVYGKRGRVAIATEDTGGIIANDLMKKMPMSTYEYLALMFQILYVIVLMLRIGISHNDIHLGNVIVTPRRNKFSLFNLENGKTYDISPHGTMYNCKIYDFDRASSIIGKNTALDKYGACAETGQCNRMDSQKDVFNVLMLIHVGPSDKTMLFFRDFLWDEMFLVDASAASKLRNVVMRNVKHPSFWQSYCFEDCERTISPLMEIGVFLDVFVKAMQKLK